MNAAASLRSRGRLFRTGLAEVGDRVRERWTEAPRGLRWALYGLVVLLVLLAPAEAVGRVMSPHTHWPSLLFHPIGTYILLAIGLNVVVGHAGLLDLGYVAFFAIGGYAMAILGVLAGWSFWQVMAVAVVLCAASGVVLGAPALRLRGDYLAIVTLGFGEIVRIVANNTEAVGASRGINNIPHPPSLFGMQFELDPLPYYYLLVGLASVVIVFVRRLESSRVGRSWAAIREDEDAAEIMGVPTFRFKLLAFCIGAVIGGLTGVVWASKVISIIPGNFPFILSATILAAVVVGGSGNLPGVICGAFLIAWLPERFRGFADYRILLFGLALAVMMTLRPEGLVPSRRRRIERAEATDRSAPPTQEAS